MIDALKLVNLTAGTAITVPESSGDVFILSTCQRTLILGFNFVPFSYLSDSKEIDVYNGIDAYKMLMEIICGLKSQLVGENEIVAQFKEAYENYKKIKNRNAHLMTIMEKLFKDAKQVRLKYLFEVGQQSYAGISRKIIRKHQVKQGSPVLIFGSGNLALSLIKQLQKKQKILITGRNSKKVSKICNELDIENIEWNRWDKYLNYSVIINTIGTKATIFDHDFFINWQLKQNNNSLFIDLGSPSSVKTSLQSENGVYQLKDVFECGAMLDRVKQSRIKEASLAIDELTVKRQKSFTINFPFGWEELQFA
jgi:glutamyl-tRNA reductase